MASDLLAKRARPAGLDAHVSSLDLALLGGEVRCITVALRFLMGKLKTVRGKNKRKNTTPVEILSIRELICTVKCE
jgi:hypothetical protein